MAKSKAPTPQEIYRQRKLREERERMAYLPIGLQNHGNTCFMNSVLQGLIATRLLSDLVLFNPIPPEIQRTAATPIVSRRSPQLTNGHTFAGPYMLPYITDMPLGDVFIGTVYKAWTAQAARRRESQSPRMLLTSLGRKYDQYLDFAQQDAHEFLRILLDAMKMEEFDVIKKRQPVPPSKNRRRTTLMPSTIQDLQNSTASTISPQPENSASSSTLPPQTNGDHPSQEDFQLMSFVDMIFGGRLTSILVCQKCKHISQTYEDFNDISLSIKPEDYFPGRKRDRFKKIVGRLSMFPGATSNVNVKEKQPVPVPAALPLVPTTTIEILRSSSVPPTPTKEKEGYLLGGGHEEASGEPPRRRSLDLPVGTLIPVVLPQEGETQELAVETQDVTPGSSKDDKDDEVMVESDGSHVIVNVTSPDDKHVEFADTKIGKEDASPEETKEVKEKEKEKKHDDGWARIGRRISLNIGLGRPKDKEKKERDRKARSMDRSAPGVNGIKEGVPLDPSTMKKSQSVGQAPSTSTTDPSTSSKSRVSSDVYLRPNAVALTAESSTSSSQRFLKPLPSQPVGGSSSTSTSSKPHSSSQNHPSYPPPKSPAVQRSRSPKPPKPSSAEAEYLRRILADVATPSSNPFAKFRPPLLHSHTSHHHEHHPPPGLVPEKEKDKSAGGMWLGLGAKPFSGIEECLRLFTAVEVLDGENLVGCRRCWKIQNGVMPSSKKEDSDDEEEEEEEVEDTPLPAPTAEGIEKPTRPPVSLPTSLNIGSATSTSTSVHIHASQSTPTVSFYSRSDATSLSSLPSSISDDNLNLKEQKRSGDDDSDSPLSLSVISERSTSTTTKTTDSDSIRVAAGPGGLPIPVISTTHVDLVTSTPNESGSESHYSSASEGGGGSASDGNREAAYARLTGATNGIGIKHQASLSKDSLVIPPRLKYGSRKMSSEASTTTDEGSSEEESDTSAGTSVSAESAGRGPRLDASGRSSSVVAVNGMSLTSSPSPSASSPGGSPKPSSSQGQVQEPPVKQQKSSKPKPTIMRPAYKRYLIATPPPVLVIHLKRFQQTSKTSLMMSFSHGFKKLDDYVSFPEHLDLSPFLAPRKEDYGLGKKGKKEKAKAKSREAEKEEVGQKGKGVPEEERCMYRLYAVVVHIGNMLGGHYIAYTALPNEPPVHHSTGTTPASSPSASSLNGVSSPRSFNGQPEGEKKVTPASEPEKVEPTERQWAYISDTTVRLTTLEEVLNSKAYICMYERC